MPTISVCMIVKNEEDVIARCLDCIKDVADELIIVDTGSTDRTKEIARRYTERLYDFQWVDDFSAARNFAFQKAAMEYILWLDADDVIDAENQKKLAALKKTLSGDVDMVFLRYEMGFDDGGRPSLSFFRERIVRRAAGFRWVGAVHEVMIPRGKLLYEDIVIEHRKLRVGEPGRNLRIYQKLIDSGTVLDARQAYYYARELLDAGRTGEAAEAFKACLKREGAREDKIGACLSLSRCLNVLGDEQRALDALLYTFRYAAPRAEALCGIGAECMRAERFQDAVYWYTAALGCAQDMRSGGFYIADYHGFLPHIQLCVCYDRLGDREKAVRHNEMAGAIKPGDPAYLHNKAYFAKSEVDSATARPHEPAQGRSR